MGIHGLKKTIVIGVVVVLLRTGVAQAANDVQKRTFSELTDGFSPQTISVGGEKITVISLEKGERLKADMGFYNQMNILVTLEGYYVEGQALHLLSGVRDEGVIFTHGGLAYFLSPQKGLWISDAKGSSKEFINAFSMRASGLLLPGQTGYTVWGVVLSKYKENLSARGWSMEAARNELGFIQSTINSALNGMGDFALLNDDGSIKDNAANRIAIFFSGGRVGTLITSGQLDPVTKKGYNWAMTPDGNTYVGLGLNMVDVKTLLTDANYRDLAMAILGNKSLMVNIIVRVTGSWLLQHGQLNGVSDDIKKFLDYDTSNLPNGFYFDVIDGKVVVVPRGGQKTSNTQKRSWGHPNSNAEPIFTIYYPPATKQIPTPVSL